MAKAKSKIPLTVNQPVMPIGVVADLLGVSVQTIHKYEKEGLIIPYKTPSNHRLFSQRDLAHLTCIRELLEKRGLNIKGIKHLMSLVPCWEILSCRQEIREKCPAYYSSEEPCWSIRTPEHNCPVEDCRECEVYLMVDHVKNMKVFLRKPNQETEEG